MRLDQLSHERRPRQPDARVWERMIRSVRAVLSALLECRGSQLDDERLETLMFETEVVVNSRPLTYVDGSDPSSAEPLTPNQLLTLRSKVVLPPRGKFVREDLYCRHHLRRVQYLANEFWMCCRKELLPGLNEQHKWNKPQDNLKSGDILLMIEDNTPRAIIEEAFQGSDTLVRKVRLRCRSSTYERPVHRLVFIYRPGIPVEEAISEKD